MQDFPAALYATVQPSEISNDVVDTSSSLEVDKQRRPSEMTIEEQLACIRAFQESISVPEFAAIRASQELLRNDVELERKGRDAALKEVWESIELEKKGRDAALKEVWESLRAQQADLKVLHESSYIAMNQILKMSEALSSMAAKVENTSTYSNVQRKVELPKSPEKQDVHKISDGETSPDSVETTMQPEKNINSEALEPKETSQPIDSTLPPALTDALKSLASKLDTINNLEYGMVCQDISTASYGGSAVLPVGQQKNGMVRRDISTASKTGSLALPVGQQKNGIDGVGSGSLVVPRAKEQYAIVGHDHHGSKNAQQLPVPVDGNIVTTRSPAQVDGNIVTTRSPNPPGWVRTVRGVEGPRIVQPPPAVGHTAVPSIGASSHSSDREGRDGNLRWMRSPEPAPPVLNRFEQPTGGSMTDPRAVRTVPPPAAPPATLTKSPSSGDRPLLHGASLLHTYAHTSRPSASCTVKPLGACPNTAGWSSSQDVRGRTLSPLPTALRQNEERGNWQIHQNLLVRQ